MTDPEKNDTSVTFAQARAILARTARLFRPYRRQVLLVALAIVVSSGLSVANPLIIRAIFDQALFPGGGGEPPNARLLVVLLAALLGVAAAASGIGVFQTYLATRVGQSVMRDLRAGLYR